MANDDRGKPVPVKKGNVGPARKAPALESTPTPRSEGELDARQARVREVRRKGPELKRGESAGGLEAPPAQVPPTDCDDENDQ